MAPDTATAMDSDHENEGPHQVAPETATAMDSDHENEGPHQGHQDSFVSNMGSKFCPGFIVFSIDPPYYQYKMYYQSS